MSKALHIPLIAINEPVLSYAPGSPERAKLKATLKQMKKEKVKIPIYFNAQCIETDNLADSIGYLLKGYNDNIKSLRKKANTASGLVDIKIIKQIEDLESSLNRGKLLLDKHMDVGLSDIDYIDLAITLKQLVTRRKEIPPHIGNFLREVVKGIISKTRQFFYQITSLFLSIFHYFDLTHNDNINELNKMKLTFIYSLKNYHEN